MTTEGRPGDHQAGILRLEELEAIPQHTRTIPEWVELVHLRALLAGKEIGHGSEHPGT